MNADGRRQLLRCGALIDGSGAKAREDVAIVIEGERISSVCAWPDWAARGDPIEARDLRGHTVVPGLIDAHAHLCLAAPGQPGSGIAPDDPVGIVMWGLAAATAALCAGITTVVDTGSPGGLALRAGALIDAGLAVGPQVFAVGPVITTTGGHGAGFATLADDATQAVRAVRAHVAAGAHLIKVMVTGGAIDPATNRRRAQYTEAELRAVAEDAHRLGRRVVGHCNATEGIIRAVNAGIDIIAHCNWLGTAPGTVEIDTGTVHAMARQAAWIDLNIGGALRGLGQADGTVVSWPYQTPPPATRWDLLQPLRERGIGLYLTSDAFGPGIGAFPQSLREALSRWDITPEALISLVSSVPARALGLDHERGRLASDKLADLLVLAGDLRSDPDTLTRPVSVYRAGQEVVSAGRLTPPAASLDPVGEAAAQQHLLDSIFPSLP